MTHVKKGLGYFLFLMTMTGCIGMLDGCGNSTLHIEDYYQIRKYDHFQDIDGRNILYCKLGFPGDPIINHIEYIEWDEKMMKLKTEEDMYYIIKAKGEKLCCGCGDVIIGPVDQKEYLKNLKALDRTTKLRHSIEFR